MINVKTNAGKIKKRWKKFLKGKPFLTEEEAEGIRKASKKLREEFEFRKVKF